MVVASHLEEKERIRLGAFYTPGDIVKKVFDLVQPFLRKDKAVVLDPAAGCGAFINQFQSYNYRASDIDIFAVNYLKRTFDSNRIYHVNALVNVSRSVYGIKEQDFLIIVGNPPYNDWTSLYKKGQKEACAMDSDVFDRDLGIAFLKAMAKLKADVICILHPMSYLIKKANFQRLKNFFASYSLIDAYIFPSFVFKWTSRSIGFPILIALYIKNKGKQWLWEDMLKFEFKFLQSAKKFTLSSIETTDDFINKYPRSDISPIGLYFQTFRDINSILRNRDFLIAPTSSTIPITQENLFDYMYLLAMKYYIKNNNSKNFWFYGNFSPLINKTFYKKNKDLFLSYVLSHIKVKNSELVNTIQKTVDCSSLRSNNRLVEKYFKELFIYAEKI